MSFKKSQSKFFTNDLSQSHQKIKTYTPKNEPNYSSLNKPNTYKVKTIENINTPKQTDQVNRSINERLQFLLRLQSPIPSAPQTVRHRVNTGYIQSSSFRGSRVNTTEFHNQDSKKHQLPVSSKLKDINKLSLANTMLENKVQQLKNIIYELTVDKNINSKDFHRDRISSQLKKSNESSPKLDYSVHTGQQKYRLLYRQQKLKNSQLQRQYNGSIVLLKMVKQQLQQLKQANYAAEYNDELYKSYRELEHQIQQLENQNSQLAQSLIMAENQINLYVNRSRQLQMQLENVSKECLKYQKHNNLMLHSSHIIQSNFQQHRKRPKMSESFQSINKDRQAILRKDEQINELLIRIQQLENKIKPKLLRQQKDYESSKLKNLSSKIVMFETESARTSRVKQDYLYKKTIQNKGISQSRLRQIESRYSEDCVKYLKQIDKLTQNIKQQQSKVKQKQTQLFVLQKKYNEIQREYKQAISKSNEAKSIKEQLQKKISEIENKKQQIEKELQSKNKIISDSKQQNDRLWKECEMLNKSINSLKTSVQELETKNIDIDKQKSNLQAQKANMIKQIIHLKQQVSLWKVTELQIRNKSNQICHKLEQIQLKHIKANNKLHIISEKLKQISDKHGYQKSSSPSKNSKVQPDHRLQILQWLQTHMDQIKHSHEKSFQQKQQEQKQYIVQLNNKFNEVVLQNSKLKQIMIFYNININQKLQDLQIHRLKQSLNSTTNRSQHHNLQIIKEQSLMIKDQQIQRLELIKKRLLEIIRTDDSQQILKSQKQAELFSLKDEIEKQEIGTDKLMEDIEKYLQRIKKTIISKQSHYQAVAKNNQLQIHQLKKQNSLVKQLKQKIQLMSLRFIEQDQRIKEIQKSKPTQGSPIVQQNDKNSQYKRRCSWNFKHQSVATIQNLQNNSQTKISFRSQIESFLNKHLSQQQSTLYNCLFELISSLHEYSNRNYLFSLFQIFIKDLRGHQQIICTSQQTIKDLISEYQKQLSGILSQQSDEEQDDKQQ